MGRHGTADGLVDGTADGIAASFHIAALHFSIAGTLGRSSASMPPGIRRVGLGFRQLLAGAVSGSAARMAGDAAL
jgi:hypothetical protein